MTKIYNLFPHQFLNEFSTARLLQILREMKEQNNWSVTYIAEQCAVSNGTASKWLSRNMELTAEKRYFLESFLTRKMQPAILKLEYIEKGRERNHYLFVLHKDLPFLTYIKIGEGVSKFIATIEKKVKEGLIVISPYFVYPTYNHGIVCGATDEDFCNAQVAFNQTPVQIYSMVIDKLDPGDKKVEHLYPEVNS